MLLITPTDYGLIKFVICTYLYLVACPEVYVDKVFEGHAPFYSIKLKIFLSFLLIFERFYENVFIQTGETQYIEII